MVLGAAETLHALAVGGALSIDVLGNVGGADETDGHDIGIVEDGIDGNLVTVDDVEDAGRQSRLDEQISEHQGYRWIALGGLQDEGVAAGNCRRCLPQRDHRREVEGCDAGDHAQGLAHRVDVDARTGALSVFALHQVRYADGELGNFETALDVALGVGDHLAVLARQGIGQLVHVAVQQIDEFHHDAGAALGVGGSPRDLCGLGIGDGGADVLDAGETDPGRDFAGHGPVDVAKAAGCGGHPLAADEVGQFLGHWELLGYQPVYWANLSGLVMRCLTVCSNSYNCPFRYAEIH